MRERIVTGIILIVLVAFIGVVDNRYLTLGFISLIAILGLNEAKNLMRVDEKIFYFLSVMAVFAILVNPLFIGVVGILAVAGYVAFYQKEMSLITPSIYPFLSLMILEALYLKSGMKSLGFLILVVALTDSMAYFVGKQIGKKFIHQGFSPTSPNKSWEGVIGGVLSATIIGGAIGVKFFGANAFLIALLVSVSSVFGDLFESYLKRRAGIKDSGNLLPGHGGVLDRIDGYLFAGVVLFAMVAQ